MYQTFAATFSRAESNCERTKFKIMRYTRGSVYEELVETLN